ncbi:cell division protein CrgA [Micromonospora sp. NPDC049559]|uniref:cell division protein CrgA n=1 Tax=Micromonospora sp. NPDC049559 TaxID=3155923 RepID=UPI0034219727
MSADRDEQVIAAYGAGEDVGQIGRRFGISEEEVRRIVAMEVGGGIGAGGDPSQAARRRRGPLAVTGIVLMVVGLLCPCAAGVAWLVTFYVSGADYPVSSLGYGNLAVGLSGMCCGLVLSVTGLILFLVDRGRR